MSPSDVQPTNGDGSPGEIAREEETPSQQTIDLQALADRVYRLLKQDLALERERLGWKWRL